MSINISMLSGRVGQDPEFKNLSNGTALLTFSMATNDGWGDKKRTNWHSIKVWAKLAEVVAPMIRKGSEVTVVGNTETETWEDRDGNKKYKTVITAREIDVHGKRESQGDDAPKKSLFKE